MVNGEIVLVSEMSGMTGIEVDTRRDIFSSAVFIDSISIMCGIQKELFHAEFWKVCLHSEKGMEKGKHIMPGSPFQKREYGKITVGIRGHIHVEMVTKEIAFPVGIPTPVAIRLRVVSFAITGSTAVFFTLADPLFPLLCGSAYGSAVPGKSQMVRVNESLGTGDGEELLVVKPENEKKGIHRFQVPAFQQRKKFGCGARRVTGSFIAFLFPFGRFHFRETVFRRKVAPIVLPDSGKEIIKSPDTGGIAEGKPAEDSIKRSFPEHATPDSDGSHFQFQSKQIRTQHTGRKTWFRTKNGVAVLHDGIGRGKIEIPELYDIIPGAFGKYKGIWIKF